MLEGSTVKFADLIDLFVEYLIAERGYSENTMLSYKNDLSLASGFWGNVVLNTISNEQITSYLQFMENEKYNARTIARRISSLRHFFVFCKTNGYIAHDPVADIIKSKLTPSVLQVLSEEEVARILHTTWQDDSPYGRRSTALIEILYSTGLRISECILLPMKDYSGTSVVINGKGFKERLVIFTPSTIKAIARYIEVRSSFDATEDSFNKWLFHSMSLHGHITRQAVVKVCKHMARLAGINIDKVFPHAFRHAMATHMLQNGADLLVLQKILGHADIKSTQIYLDVSNEHVNSVIEEAHPINKDLS